MYKNTIINKKGQISIFIVVGLSILLATILVIAVFSDSLTFKPPETIITQEILTELEPFVFAVETCQEQLLTEATGILLSQGGYLNPEEAGILAIRPPFGSGAVFSQDQLIPYWHYRQNGVSQSRMPDLQGGGAMSIENQLREYVNDRLYDCIDWDAFTEYEFTLFEEPTTTMQFAQRETTVLTQWPMQVRVRDANQEINGFARRTNIPVKNLYDIAKETIESLRMSQLPEHMALEWLTIYAVGDTALPPMYKSITINPTVLVYPLATAEDELRAVLSLKTDFLQLYGSRDAQLTFSDMELLNNMQLDSLFIVRTEPMNTRVRASMSIDSPIFFSINNNEAVAISQRMEGLNLLGLVPPLRDDLFKYGLTYPIFLTFEEEGFQLRIAYQVNIRDNVPLIDDDSTDDVFDICADRGGSEVTVETNADAHLFFSCGEHTCSLGDTSDNRIQTVLPTCAEGRIEATAGNLFSDSISLRSFAGRTENIQLNLYEPRTIPIQLFAREIEPRVSFNVNIDPTDILPILNMPIGIGGPGINSGGAYVKTYHLTDNEFPMDANLILIRRDSPFVATVSEDRSITLVPGTYDIFMHRVEEFDPPLTIPERVECMGPGGIVGFFVGCDEIVLPELEFPTLITGYLERVGENAITIPYIPERIEIVGVRIRPEEDLREHGDISLIGELFEKQELITEPVRLIN